MRKYTIFLLCFLAVACTQPFSEAKTDHPISNNSAVASGKPQATDAGILMLENGGNAVDAAVATAFALSVVEPSMSGIGGRMQAIIRLNDGEVIGIDGTTLVPAAYDTNVVSKAIYGYHVVGVPGVVAGLCTIQEKYGNLDLATVMAPAISLARNGFPISEIESYMHSAVFTELQEFAGTRKHFLNEAGEIYKAGDVFVQPELAETLSLIAQQGKDVFYNGIIAEKIVEDNNKNGGVLSLADLQNYEVKESRVLRTTYRGFEVQSLWLPSFGAITIEILNILETLPLEAYPESEWIKIIYKAMLLGYADRGKQFSLDTSDINLVLKSYAEGQASQLLETLSPPAQHDPNDLMDAEDARHTTNLVTADEDGMMVVLTQSLGPIMGSKVATPGLGFMHATASGKYLMAFEPGIRTSSHISPVIVEIDGEPFLGIGAAGGSRIVTAITNVLSRIIDHDMSISEAILAPRVYPAPDSIHLETGTIKPWPADMIKSLTDQSLPVSTMPDPTHFGIVHGILFDTLNHMWIPAAEPDWDGKGSATKD